MFRDFLLKIVVLLVFCGFHIAYGKDRFSVEPEDQTVRQGDQVSFVCQLAHARDRVRPVRWTRDGNSIPDEPRFRVIDSQTEGEYTLTISNAQPGDSGYYNCVVGKGRHLGRSRRARLEVVPNAPRQQHRPSLVAEPADVASRQGERVVLECSVAGYSGQVEWLRDGVSLGTDRSLPEYSRYSIIGNEQAGEFNLMINNVQVEDDAEYACTTDPQTGLRSASARVTVLVPPETPFIEEAKASIVPVILGKPVMLTCRAKGGKPAAEISWLRDGQPVVSKVHYMTEPQDDGTIDAVSTVKVTANRRDHGRRLECVASSQALTDPSRAFVIMNVQYAPHVTMRTNATRRMYEHQSVTFSCEAVGNPNKMKWKWFVNDDAIEGETSNKFAITDVSRDYHHSEISCAASNRAGTNKRSFKFNILFSPTVSISANVEGDVEVSQRVVLTCDAKANPGRINWRWYKNEEQLVEGQTTLRLDLGRITQEDDGSMISCEATNRIGTNSSTYTVKIAKPETTPLVIVPTTHLPATTPEEAEISTPEAEVTSELPEAEAETEPTAEAEVEAETTPEAESEVGAETTPEAEAEVGAETTPEGEAEGEVGAETTPEAEAEVGAETTPEGESESEGGEAESEGNESNPAVGASKCQGDDCSSAPVQVIGSVTLFTMLLVSCSSLLLHSLS